MRRNTGFTLIEAVIAATLILLLIGVALSIAVESSSMVAVAESDTQAQSDALRASRRLTELVRKTGWNQESTNEYPQVLASGTQLHFRLLRDLDGNGEPYDDATGLLEWGAEVYRVRLDPDTQNLLVEDSNGELVLFLAQHVQSVSFATYKENPALERNEVAVTLSTLQATPRGEPINYSWSGSIHMRN